MIKRRYSTPCVWVKSNKMPSCAWDRRLDKMTSALCCWLWDHRQYAAITKFIQSGHNIQWKKVNVINHKYHNRQICWENGELNSSYSRDNSRLLLPGGACTRIDPKPWLLTSPITEELKQLSGLYCLRSYNTIKSLRIVNEAMKVALAPKKKNGRICQVLGLRVHNPWPI